MNKSHHRVVIEQVDSLLKHYGADYVEFRSLGRFAPATLTDSRYTVQKLQTYVVPLSQGTQELWSNLGRRCRKAIRKARKNNVEVVEATDKGFMGVYHEMLKDTYGKSNRPPPFSQEDYSTVWDVLRPYDRIKVLLAEHEGRVMASVIFLRFGSKVCGWDGAAFRAYYSLCPNNLLHWTLIEWGASNGMLEYDMMGANIPSIANFKESFGGELRTYTYAYKDVSWQAQIGRRLYRWLVPQIRRVQFRLRPS